MSALSACLVETIRLPRRSEVLTSTNVAVSAPYASFDSPLDHRSSWKLIHFFNPLGRSSSNLAVVIRVEQAPGDLTDRQLKRAVPMESADFGRFDEALFVPCDVRAWPLAERASAGIARSLAIKKKRKVVLNE